MLTVYQKKLCKQLESGCYISHFLDLGKNKSEIQLIAKDGKPAQQLSYRTILALESKGLVDGETHEQDTAAETKTHHYRLNTEVWAKVKPGQHGGKRPGQYKPRKPEGEAKKIALSGHRWAEKDPTYKMLLQLTAKERKDCYSLLFAVCRDVDATPEQLSLFAKIKNMEL